MPTMPRLNEKTTKIAYAILGVPASMRHKKTEKQKEIDKRLIFEETTRSR